MHTLLLTAYILIFLSVMLVCIVLCIFTPYKKDPTLAERIRMQPFAFRLTRQLSTILRLDKMGSYGSRARKDALRKHLYNAGLKHHVLPEEFLLLKYMILVFLLLVSFGLYISVPNNIVIISIMFLISIVVYMYPDIWLRKKIQSQREHFNQLFPFMLDLLVLSIRAGLTLTAAIDHAVTKLPTGPLKNEFTTVLLDIRTGLSRKDALYAMSDRVKLAAVANFVSVVNQVEETGGELGNVLTIQARQRRTERFLRAEKLANQAPVKILVPLIGLLFPVTLILILFPVFIKARHTGVLNMLF